MVWGRRTGVLNLNLAFWPLEERPPASTGIKELPSFYRALGKVPIMMILDVQL